MNLYLIHYRYGKSALATLDGKMAVEAESVQEATSQFFALPDDEFEAEQWSKDLKSLQSLSVEFFCRK